MTTNETRGREIVKIVLAEAVGSSFTPFVPVPFVDDYLFGRLLRRITRKVLERAGMVVDKALEKAVVEGYTKAGESPLGERAFTAAARFVVRKVAVVLDVKRSHDVFGEAIAFALALDVAALLHAVRHDTALGVGRAIFSCREAVGSAAIEVLTRAGREAFKSSEGESSPLSERAHRVADAIGREVEETRARLEQAMRQSLPQIR